MGEALAPLRNQGVIITGIGHSCHSEGGSLQEGALKFHHRITCTVESDILERDERKNHMELADTWPHFYSAYPNKVHFLPLVTVIAAADFSRGTKLFQNISESKIVTHYRFD